ncbi:MAG TPA: hypothetical protein VF406_17640 [Thermodesulfobacteriota bacterium]
MGLLDRLFGGDRPEPPPDREARPARPGDEQAIARYRYLLRTAPPEAIEQAHAEAFAQLTAEQRVQVLGQLAREAPPGERLDPSRDADPRTLARAATRAEMRRPGTLERSFGGVGMGGAFAGSLLGTIAGAFIGTAIANQLLGGFDAAGAAEPDPDAPDPDATAEDAGDAGGFDEADDFGSDSGGDVGDF